MSFFGDILDVGTKVAGAVTGSPWLPIAGNLLSGALNQGAADDRQDSAQGFSAQQYATRYQTTTADMKAAGINPMLAIQGIGTSFPTGVVASSPGYPDLGTTYTAARTADAQIERDIASAEQARAQSQLIDETVTKVKQEVTNLGSENARIRKTIDLLEEQRQNAVKEGYNLTEQGNMIRSTVRKLDAEPGLIHADMLLKWAQAALTEQSTLTEQTRTQLGRQDVKVGEDLDSLGKRAQSLEPLFRILRMVLQRH